MKNKIIIGLLSLVILGAVIFSIVTITKSRKNKNEIKIDGLDVLDNKAVLKDTKFDGLDITNQTIYTQNGASNYYMTITNNTKDDYQIGTLYVVFTIGDRKISSLGLAKTKIKAGDSIDVNISFGEDISKVSKITFTNENEEVN